MQRSPSYPALRHQAEMSPSTPRTNDMRTASLKQLLLRLAEARGLFFANLVGLLLLLPFFDLRPSIAQGHGPVEDQLAGHRVPAVHAEVTEPLELVAIAGCGIRQAQL